MPKQMKKQKKLWQKQQQVFKAPLMISMPMQMLLLQKQMKLHRQSLTRRWVRLRVLLTDSLQMRTKQRQKLMHLRAKLLNLKKKQFFTKRIKSSSAMLTLQNKRPLPMNMLQSKKPHWMLTLQNRKKQPIHTEQSRQNSAICIKKNRLNLQTQKQKKSRLKHSNLLMLLQPRRRQPQLQYC